MARLDGKIGRFSPDSETNEIHTGLRDFQDGFGDHIAYYRFLAEASVMHDIYDEGTNGGRRYIGPIDIPVLQVIHEEAGNEDTDIGFYYNDDLHVTISFKTFERAGYPTGDIGTDKYLRDRIVYDGKVFRVMKMAVLGQVQRRDLIVSIEATQVRGDELVSDAQWAQYSD